MINKSKISVLNRKINENNLNPLLNIILDYFLF